MADRSGNDLDEGRAAPSRGFTLIELLVAVLVIGILAAIAIPVYVGVQSDATQSSARSDLTNAKIAAVAYYTLTETFPPAIDADTLGAYGYTGTTVVDASTGPAAITDFCLSAPGAQGAVWYVTETAGPTLTKPSGCA